MNIDQLRLEIRTMTRRSGLFKALKEELGALGYWKNKDRGISGDRIRDIKASKHDISEDI